MLYKSLPKWRPTTSEVAVKSTIYTCVYFTSMDSSDGANKSHNTTLLGLEKTNFWQFLTNFKQIFDIAEYLEKDVDANIMIFIWYPNKQIPTIRMKSFGPKAKKILLSETGQHFCRIWKRVNDPETGIFW